MAVFRRRILGLNLFVILIGSVTIYLFAQPTPTNQNQESPRIDQASGYEVLAKGVVGSRPFQVQFQSAPLRLEFRNLVMGLGDAEAIPVPTNILMELRQGGVTTVINKESHERHQGDFWAVGKGDSLSIKNPGQVAVIRAIYIFEETR